MPKAKGATSSAASEKHITTVLLNQKAEVKDVKVKLDSNGQLTLVSMQAALKKKTNPELIGVYPLKKNFLHLFGYQTGKAGTENKHELPPPHDSILCFGDILVVATASEGDWSQPLEFKISDYEQFYTRAFGGFEELDEEGEDLEEEEELVEEEEEEIEEEEAEEAEEEEEEEEEPEEEEVEQEDAASIDNDDDAPKKKIKNIAKKINAQAKNTSGSGKGKKTTKKGNSSSALAGGLLGSASTYSNYIYVPQENQLREEWNETPLGNGVTTEPERTKMLRSLRTLFKDWCNDEEIQQLERCIFNATIRRASERHVACTWSHSPFVELYKMNAKSIAGNFNPNSYIANTELFDKYKKGEITFADICGMDSYQMFEARWKDNFIQRQAQEKRQLEGNRAMATDRFTCTRCWKKECTYYEMQTRSADEPMTIFITCLNCGKHWRQ